jgi:hypothetical protein
MAKKNGTEGAAATGAGPGGASGKPKNKTEAVKRALDENGRDFKPLQICAYVKEKWGIDISPDVASNYKKAYLKGKKKKGSKGKAGRKRAVAAAAHETVAAESRPQAKLKVALAGCTVEDIRTVRELVERFGPDALHSLIRVIAK